MQKIVVLRLVLVCLACSGVQGESGDSKKPRDARIDHVVRSLSGEPVDLTDYRGKAMLIVNTASKCGFTPQYADLQKLHEEYADRGLVVIGFPSNDFGGQEPGSAEEIETFCRRNYGVSFPMMAKVHAKGPDKAPIYKTLTEDTSEEIRGEVKWNFTKFLVDPEGQVVRRFGSRVKPMSGEMIEAVEAVLP
jgi:glutathione peroxidase